MIGFGGRSSPCVFLLGYFDAVHIGHRALIARAKEIASELEIETGALTFTGSKKGAQVYVLEERERILSSLGVGFLYEADFESPFRDLSGEAFLETVADRCGVRAFVCGEDFRFGEGASCGADFLKRFCRERGIEAEVVKWNIITPLDTQGVITSATKTGHLLVAEECVEPGCVGERVLAALEMSGTAVKAALVNCGREYVTHGSTDVLKKSLGLDQDSLFCRAMEVLDRGH